MFSVKIFKISEKHLEASAKSIIFAIKLKKKGGIHQKRDVYFTRMSDTSSNSYRSKLFD